MVPNKTLDEVRQKMQDRVQQHEQKMSNSVRISVGMATCGIAAGAQPVYDAIVEDLSMRGKEDVQVTRTGCIGVCRLEPIVEVYTPGEEKVTYVRMTAEKAKRVVAEHIVNHRVVRECTISAAE